MILVYGARGNMGRRYMAILRSLGITSYGVDLDTDPRAIPHKEAAGYIIATPTDTHIRLMRALLPQKRPILCEKPWSKDIHELRDFMSDLGEGDKRRLSMVAQYRHLIPGLRGRGVSLYDYYRHGGDGLAWDCIQIVGLSNGPVILREKSPVWRCLINGHTINVGGMDGAYVTDVQEWVSGRGLSINFISEAHEKTHEKALELSRGLH